jgi:hypothetical protein
VGHLVPAGAIGYGRASIRKGMATMGPVNWLAVMVAALVAGAVRTGWLRLAGGTRAIGLTLALMLVSSAMIGHMFARVGAATLAVKPWLYFMMSGGLALAFIAPALIIAHREIGTPMRRSLLDAAGWIVVYLAMGTTYYAMGRF